MQLLCLAILLIFLFAASEALAGVAKFGDIIAVRVTLGSWKPGILGQSFAPEHRDVVLTFKRKEDGVCALTLSSEGIWRCAESPPPNACKNAGIALVAKGGIGEMKIYRYSFTKMQKDVIMTFCSSSGLRMSKKIFMPTYFWRPEDGKVLRIESGQKVRPFDPAISFANAVVDGHRTVITKQWLPAAKVKVNDKVRVVTFSTVSSIGRKEEETLGKWEVPVVVDLGRRVSYGVDLVRQGEDRYFSDLYTLNKKDLENCHAEKCIAIRCTDRDGKHLHHAVIELQKSCEGRIPTTIAAGFGLLPTKVEGLTHRFSYHDPSNRGVRGKVTETDAHLDFPANGEAPTCDMPFIDMSPVVP